MSSLSLPDVADLQGLGASELEQTLRDLDMARRHVEYLIAETVASAEHSRVYRRDGHRNVSAWARATCNWSSNTARLAMQTGRLLAASAAVRQAAGRGELGVDQLQLLSRLCANPRARHHFDASAALLIADAKGLWFDEFAVVAARWEALADEDGGHGAHERAYACRNAHVVIAGDQVFIDGHGGVLAGSAMQEIFERFRDAEFAADWELGLALHGDDMSAQLMERSDRQRRFDALHSIFLAAARSGVVAAVDPLVNIVVDHDTFEHHVRRLSGVGVEPLDPASFHDRRCETIDGNQLDPVDVVAAALLGHVRRVVFDSASVVTNLGRKRRLFSGAVADAVRLGDKWCMWPGCDVRAGRCQIDHSRPWTWGGDTQPGNGGVGCGHHNRFKQRGYRTWRDRTGTWHVQRPDGSEIGFFADANAPPPLIGA